MTHPAALLTLCALALAAGSGGRVTGGATWAGAVTVGAEHPMIDIYQEVT